MIAVASHARTRIALSRKNSRGGSERSWIATNVVNAASASPARTKNVSIAAFPLYFISRVVGSQSTCAAVFCSE
jgi:hypothetical protein